MSLFFININTIRHNKKNFQGDILLYLIEEANHFKYMFTMFHMNMHVQFHKSISKR